MGIWQWLGVIALVAIILLLTAKAMFRAYFAEKDAFVDRLIRKLKGANDGESS